MMAVQVVCIVYDIVWKMIMAKTVFWGGNWAVKVRE